MKKFICLIYFVFTANALAQYPNVKVNTTNNAPEETSIAINPTNPDNMIGVANVHGNYYYSNDGGLTWTEGRLIDPYILGDPSITFDANGNAYYCNIGKFTHSAIFVNKSIDGGASWYPSVAVVEHAGAIPFEDKPYITCDITDSPYRNNIYVGWTQFTQYGSTSPNDSSFILFSRSTDGGATFSTPIRISDTQGDALDSDNTVQGAVPAVGPNGEVYIAWAGPLGLVFDRSFDGGQSFGVDKIITDIPGGWDFRVSGIYRCNGLPITAADISNSPYRGRVYIVWSDQRNGDTDIFLVYSSNRGDTWSSIIRVNDDEIGNGKEQFFPWVSVDPITGAVNIVFYDRRNYPDDQTDVYLARSTDGGETFTNIKISTSPFIPTSSIFFGDYIGIASYNNRIRPLWMRLHNSILSLYTAIIDSPIPVEEHFASTVFRHKLGQSYPNPFNSTTAIEYDLPTSEFVSLKLYNILGQEIITLVNQHQKAGKHRVRFDAGDLSSGIYFCKISAGTFIKINKMLLIH